ncbi:TetR/AcrR family transcriptional regulator [Paenibacillus sp. CFBP 13594]|uniref:TetR/AcrR family transcriptional regulator n=1 Tax=Paenibacillus sp. CFBP 13594 TaxID=2774037 RepID=UPI0018D971D2|nr:TetR/AcrR family transcriptional regulator [Paenibacillus sp. CFBP 13594]
MPRQANPNDEVIIVSASHLTKHALAHSLKSLMEHTPLNKITVKHLVDHCGVNRQTFYYHFQDIYALLGWIYQTEAVESLMEYRSYSTWTDGFYKIFCYIENNKTFCCNTLNSLGRTHLDSYLYEVTHDLIMGVIDELACGIKVRGEDKEFVANFYTLAFTGLIIQWMRGNMQEPPKQIIEKLSELIEGNVLRALHRYENKLPSN